MDRYQYLIALAVLTFAIGLAGVVVRRNLMVVVMCVEVMLNSVVLAFVVFAARSDAGNSRSRCEGGASSMISRMRVSSIGRRAAAGPGASGRLRLVAEGNIDAGMDVGVDIEGGRCRECFLSKNRILPAYTAFGAVTPRAVLQCRIAKTRHR